jgi:antitoxin component YwqK of YwqJK toxin-antitoxin module
MLNHVYSFLRNSIFDRMKTKLIMKLLVVFSCLAMPAMAQQGFTDKAEAKNELVNGLKEGKWIEYTDSNSINTDTTPLYLLIVYKAGKPCEIVHEYYKANGKLFSETPYTNGKKNGTEKYYYESGKLMEEDTYADDEENGVKKEYYETGQLEYEIPYTNGAENGVSKDYYEDGKIHGEIPYQGGKKNGVQKEYYQKGKIKSEVPYTHDKIIGLQKNYYESGIEKSETVYINGKAGVTKDFDENGKEIK